MLHKSRVVLFSNDGETAFQKENIISVCAAFTAHCFPPPSKQAVDVFPMQ